jgi:hypothetical protein
MVRFQRVVTIKPGKRAEGNKWAKEIADFINNNESRASFQVFREEFGNVSAIHWISDFENLAVFEQVMANLLSKEEYIALTSRSADIIVPGTAKDSLLRSF